MNQYEAIVGMEAEWDLSGFFGQLRSGRFNVEDANRVLRVLRGIRIADAEPLEQDLVRQLWYIPLFCEWQKERVQKLGGDVEALTAFTSLATGALETLLGVP